jgi:hypothetical protein
MRNSEIGDVFWLRHAREIPEGELDTRFSAVGNVFLSDGIGPVQGSIPIRSFKASRIRLSGYEDVCAFTDPRYATGIAYGFRSGTGITALDA